GIRDRNNAADDLFSMIGSNASATLRPTAPSGCVGQREPHPPGIYGGPNPTCQLDEVFEVAVKFPNFDAGQWKAPTKLYRSATLMLRTALRSGRAPMTGRPTDFGRAYMLGPHAHSD